MRHVLKFVVLGAALIMGGCATTPAPIAMPEPASNPIESVQTEVADPDVSSDMPQIALVSKVYTNAEAGVTYVAFDPVQWLQDDAAEEAMIADSLCDGTANPCASGGFYVRNQTVAMQELPLAPATEIIIIRSIGGDINLESVSSEIFATMLTDAPQTENEYYNQGYLQQNPFELMIVNDQIVAMQQRYVP